jgi:hypothetical protein
MGCLCQATKKMAELAQQIQHLRGFVHVSTSYVNSNLGRGSHIEEAVYPLQYRPKGARVAHAKLALQLAALPPAKAERTVTTARSFRSASAYLCSAACPAWLRGAHMQRLAHVSCTHTGCTCQKERRGS